VPSWESTIIDSTFSSNALGQLAGVVGTIGWARRGDGNIGTLLKIAGSDLPGASLMTAKDLSGASVSDGKPFRVYGGFIAMEGRPYRPAGTMACVFPNQFCAYYLMPVSMALFRGLLSQTLAIGFNRQATGGLDTTLPLQIGTAVSTSRSEFNAFGDCISSIAKSTTK
jgi:hypothetical protein